MTKTDLTQRQGLPDALRVLLAEFPQRIRQPLPARSCHITPCMPPRSFTPH